MSRSFYSKSFELFCEEAASSILGVLTSNNPFTLEQAQRDAWLSEITLLKRVVASIGKDSGHILLEYSIPRMGKRVDAVLLTQGIVFILEFKVGLDLYQKEAIDQVWDYEIDLKNFHGESHTRLIVPIVVATKAPNRSNDFKVGDDRVLTPLKANALTLLPVVQQVISHFKEAELNPVEWEGSLYKPTPTIIEAAQVLYRGHSVKEITRSDAGATNLTETTSAILAVIQQAKAENRKAICFVTGVPGAGKTLVGLNIANASESLGVENRAVFLSGNGPLVKILQEALARDKVEQAKLLGRRLRKEDALSKTKSFIQNVHVFRDEAINTDRPLNEKVVIFDEAQRAWTSKQASKFMAKRGLQDFDQSEPEFLIGVMDRQPYWTVIICLVGGGQEINTGEAGLPEWFRALHKSYPKWDVYVSDRLTDFEYTQGEEILTFIDPRRLFIKPSLHLGVSIRSYRSERVSEFVKAILDLEVNRARLLYKEIHHKYPIFITRDLNTAKEWLRKTARGTERYGLLASSGALRLKPYGIHVKSEIGVEEWFLNGKDDIRSSYFLEEVATEFDIQGLELDWTCVAWDADLRLQAGKWVYCNFRGNRWSQVNGKEHQYYLKNAYRVLLTRLC